MIVFCRHIPRSVLSGPNIVSSQHWTRSFTVDRNSLLPRYPYLYYLTSYILVKLIRHVKWNNFDRIFQFLKFPPTNTNILDIRLYLVEFWERPTSPIIPNSKILWTKRSKQFSTKTQFQFLHHLNPDRIRHCANNPFSPLLQGKQDFPLSRPIQTSVTWY